MKDATKDFVKKMDVLFSQYKNDGCLDNYILEDWDPEFIVNEDDSIFMWSAIDGAIHLYNLEHGTMLSFEEYDDKETGRCHFIISE